MKKIIVAFGVIVSQSIAYDVCAGDFLEKYEKTLDIMYDTLSSSLCGNRTCEDYVKKIKAMQKRDKEVRKSKKTDLLTPQEDADLLIIMNIPDLMDYPQHLQAAEKLAKSMGIRLEKIMTSVFSNYYEAVEICGSSKKLRARLRLFAKKADLYNSVFITACEYHTTMFAKYCKQSSNKFIIDEELQVEGV